MVAPRPRHTSPLRSRFSSMAEEIEVHLDAIATHGFTILRDVINSEQLSAIAAAVDHVEEELQIEKGTNLFEGFATTRVYNLLVHGKVFESIPLHPRVLPVVEGVLDPGLLISSLSSIRIGPGEAAQPLHADDQLIPLPRPHVPVICNTMWAITDFTAENGATRVVPASHLDATLPEFTNPPATIPAEMEAGSVLVWVGSLWHGGGANLTDTFRLGIAMNYCAGYLRQQENQQLGIPVDVARDFPARLRELCGYSVYRGLIGHIDKRHPAEIVLDADDNVRMIWDSSR